MKNKSSLLGLVGLVMVIFGISFFLGGISYGVVSLIFGFIGISMDFLATMSIFGLLSGAVLFIIGMKIFFENETASLRFLLGALGINMFIVGIIVAIAFSVAFPLGWFALFLLWSLGLSLIAYGFRVDALKPFNKLLNSFKKLLNVRR